MQEIQFTLAAIVEERQHGLRSVRRWLTHTATLGHITGVPVAFGVERIRPNDRHSIVGASSE